MKKFICILLCFISLFTLISCKKKDKEVTPDPEPPKQEPYDPFEGFEEYPYIALWQECRERFFDEMYIVAQKLGCKFKRENIVSPIGISNYTITVRDMLAITIAATNNKICREIMELDTYECDIEGPRHRHATMESLVTRKNTSHLLNDYYEINGGKTGSLAKTESHPALQTLGISVKGPNNSQFILYESTEGNTTDTDNIFTRAKLICDIGMRRYNDPNADVSDLLSQIKCDAFAIVCIPEGLNVNTMAGYDWLGLESDYILYAKNPDKYIITASTWKMLTTLTATQFIFDYNKKVTVGNDDINASSGELFAGDILSYYDLFNYVYQLSTNTGNNTIAQTIGLNLLIHDDMKLNGLNPKSYYIYDIFK